MTEIISYIFITIGIIFWFWGTSSLLASRTVLYKIHNLTVSDSLGSILIIVGLLFKIPRELPLLILAIISIAIWNTMLSYILAYCSSTEENKTKITVERESII
ncbi:multisubunit sodium/proton antiporter, MrpG subunit [Cyanobacterium stanieri PCC 7202]|uniref:Multisubunit sodium/proton antiporter, MrpG subunit n=1 Tax=Cyanobacterium stanieri (strain ATCC 29140 / PCC 7202) TaxID=292563 RepID=K9YHS9_CYASC|nr:multisubunit sodium/proton antiporter, MrpG subunit [Cyanobacterium stanieri PCC 7202]